MSSPVQEEKSYFSSVLTYLTPCLAASGAIIPSFYFFAWKSALQTNNTRPQMNFYQAIKGGLRAAPTVGFLVGWQMTLQKIFESVFDKAMPEEKNKRSAQYVAAFASTLFVSLASAPSYAIFNGQTLGRTMKESLKTLSWNQTGAIVLREFCFLFSLRLSDPLSEFAKKKGEGNPFWEYGAAFASGAIGSICGHAGDAALTLEQKGFKDWKWTHLRRGLEARAGAVGLFTVCYKFISCQLAV